MNSQLIKKFNTTGPCIPEKHYMLSVLSRLPGVYDLISNESYFIIHAPRQSGKTTFFQSLVDKINSEGNYYSLYCSLEIIDNVKDDDIAMTRILANINQSLYESSVNMLNQKAVLYDKLSSLIDPSLKIRRILNKLSVELDKELVVFFDEADCLSSDAPLLTFLHQIRIGYNNRYISAKTKFPRSLVLIGMRNIRDYLTANHPESVGEHLASPFNIASERMALANFTKKEIGQLYGQHTEATGQVFHDNAIERAWYWTEGQPWLVNALAKQTIEKSLNNDYSISITAEYIDQAAQNLILRNDTHFDSIKERLNEPKVRRVVEAIIIGAKNFPKVISDDDIKYTLDIGLLKINKIKGENFQISNPFYREVITRTLTTKIQRELEYSIPDSYVNKWINRNLLDMSGLLKDFQLFWSENSEMYIQNNMYDSLITNSINSAISKLSIIDDQKFYTDIITTIRNDLINLTNEALTHLVLFAFLQRVLNGGADFIQREYALGTLRADICVSYKGRRYPIELKIKGNKSQDDSLEQLFEYMNKCLAMEGWLVIFDKDFIKQWAGKIYWETQKYADKTIHIVGC